MACEDADAADEALNAAIAGPKRVKGDAGEVENHSLKDLIEADKYQRAKCAGSAGKPGFGIRLAKIKLPGAS